MNLNLLAISIGNTRTRLGAFLEGKLVQSAVLENDHFASLGPVIEKIGASLADRDDARAVMASVSPRLAEQVTAALAGRFELLRVEKDIPAAIGRQVDADTLVGEDRLLNAAAAYNVLRQACVVVDAGTAITIDFVDGAGTFHGGAIGPGAQLMLNSLRQQTAQLPQVSLAAPREAIGRNTGEAMRSAVFHGLRGMVKELVEQYAEAVGSYPMVIATGGDAELLFGDFVLVERIVPELTLLGIAASVQAMIESERG